MELSKTGSSYRIEGIGVEPLPANAVVEKNVAEVESVGESVKRALAKSKIKSKTRQVKNKIEKLCHRGFRIIGNYQKNHHALQSQRRRDGR